MPQEDAELLEIGVRQVRQDLIVNPVLAERRFILAKPQTAQPFADVHDRVSRPRDGDYRLGWADCPRRAGKKEQVDWPQHI